MGLGVALSGFLTGFARQAAAEIKERNVELRKNIDEQIENHKKKVADAIEDRKEKREAMRMRLDSAEGYFDALEKKGVNLNIAQRAYIIQSDSNLEGFAKLYAESINDPRKLKTLSDAIVVNKNTPDFKSIDQAIERTTALEKITAPVVVSEKTAFGLGSNIQKTAIENYKASMPEAFEETQKRARIRGGILPFETPGFDPVTYAVASKNLNQKIANTISQNMTDIGKGLILKTDPNTKEFSITDAATNTPFAWEGDPKIANQVNTLKKKAIIEHIGSIAVEGEEGKTIDYESARALIEQPFFSGINIGQYQKNRVNKYGQGRVPISIFIDVLKPTEDKDDKDQDADKGEDLSAQEASDAVSKLADDAFKGDAIDVTSDQVVTVETETKKNNDFGQQSVAIQNQQASVNEFIKSLSDKDRKFYKYIVTELDRQRRGGQTQATKLIENKIIQRFPNMSDAVKQYIGLD